MKRIKACIDLLAITGWNKNDAVGLVNQAVRTFWVESGKSSSCYADGLGISGQNRLVWTTPNLVTLGCGGGPGRSSNWRMYSIVAKWGARIRANKVNQICRGVQSGLQEQIGLRES